MVGGVTLGVLAGIAPEGDVGVGGPHDRPRPAIGMGSFEMAQCSGVRSGVLMMAERAFWMECSCSFAYFWNLVFSPIWMKGYR